MAKPTNRSSYTPVGLEDDHGSRSHQIQMSQQDDDLDHLQTAVQRLGNMSLNISNELDSQNIMLDDLNEDTDHAKEALDAITKKTKELIHQTGGMKYFCIIILLSCISFILTYLVIMT